MSINRRIFGTPITGTVRAELDRRQSINKEIEFGESQVVEGSSGRTNKTTLTQYQELSSRTPFVRMWTGLKLIDAGKVADAQKTEIPKEDVEVLANGEYSVDAKYGKDPLGVEYTKPSIIPVKNSNQEVINYVLREEGTRDKIDFARQIYIIGDKGYEQSYGVQDANESLTTNDTVNNNDNLAVLGGVFPQELKTNPLLKPQSGITSLRVETTGELGVIKKTTVNFLVHNFYDFDKIFNKYFLKPGATIFVDYGWNTVKNLYEPAELLDEEDLELYLYGDETQGDAKTGIITENQSDFDVIQGLVSDYNAKILPNGSVECSVTLTSANSTILNFKPDDDFPDRMKKILQKGVLFYGVTSFLADAGKKEEFGEFYNTPDKDSATLSEAEYNKKLNTRALQTFGFSSPTGEAVKKGIFISTGNVDDVYISWGFFEDFIINTQFGFGKSKQEINKGNKFQVRMDSSESFTTWSEKKTKLQRYALNDSGTSPDWVYPDWWERAEYKTPAGEPTIGKSYSHNEKKNPRNREKEDGSIYEYDSLEIFKDDITETRIPIREIFINIETIVEAFENPSNKGNVRKIITEILNTLNDDKTSLFDWAILSGNVDSQLKVIDKKYISRMDRKKYEDSLTKAEDKHFFNFNIMSPNSMVKDYNLELKLPTGDMANYYALNALSHDSTLTKVKPTVRTALETTYGLSSDQLSIVYEPDNGGYRAEQSLNENSDSEAFNVFDSIKKMTSSEIRPVVKNQGNSSGGTGKKIKNQSKKDPKDSKKINTSILDKIVSNNEALEKVNNRVHALTTDDFFTKKIFKEEVETEESLPLPYFLTLTIFGIGSILPGDTFTVDYLPQEHLDNSYLQTMKVSHELNPSGWFTTLDTQYRTKFIKNVDNPNTNTTPIIPANIRLSPRALSDMKLTNGHYYPNNSNGFMAMSGDEKNTPSSFKVPYLMPFMKDVVVEQNIYYSVTREQTILDGLILTFTTPGESEKKDGTFAEPELNKLKGIWLQSAYAEFAFIDKTLDEADPFYKTQQRNFDKFNQETKIFSDLLIEGNGIHNGLYGELSTGLGLYPAGETSQTAPFVFMDPGVLKNLSKKGTSYAKIPQIDRTRVYPPSVEFVPNEEYKMLLLDSGRYAIFRPSKFANYRFDALQKTIKFFSTNTDEVNEIV